MSMQSHALFQKQTNETASAILGTWTADHLVTSLLFSKMSCLSVFCFIRDTTAEDVTTLHTRNRERGGPTRRWTSWDRYIMPAANINALAWTASAAIAPREVQYTLGKRSPVLCGLQVLCFITSIWFLSQAPLTSALSVEATFNSYCSGNTGKE